MSLATFWFRGVCVNAETVRGEVCTVVTVVMADDRLKGFTLCVGDCLVVGVFVTVLECLVGVTLCARTSCSCPSLLAGNDVDVRALACCVMLFDHICSPDNCVAMVFVLAGVSPYVPVALVADDFLLLSQAEGIFAASLEEQNFAAMADTDISVPVLAVFSCWSPCSLVWHGIMVSWSPGGNAVTLDGCCRFMAAMADRISTNDARSVCVSELIFSLALTTLELQFSDAASEPFVSALFSLMALVASLAPYSLPAVWTAKAASAASSLTVYLLSSVSVAVIRDNGGLPCSSGMVKALSRLSVEVEICSIAWQIGETLTVLVVGDPWLHVLTC